jgi:hypothetical protein
MKSGQFALYFPPLVGIIRLCLPYIITHYINSIGDTFVIWSLSIIKCDIMNSRSLAALAGAGAAEAA